nr:MAG TPA: hypothetical protein [Caudoviricetes sp.]
MGKITRNDFIKIRNRYLLKNSNSVYVNEAEMQKIIADNSYNDAEIEEKRKDDKKVVTENEAEPITTDVVKKTVTTKK